jgi:hypothetical protein
MLTILRRVAVWSLTRKRSPACKLGRPPPNPNVCWLPFRCSDFLWMLLVYPIVTATLLVSLRTLSTSWRAQAKQRFQLLMPRYGLERNLTRQTCGLEAMPVRHGPASVSPGHWPCGLVRIGVRWRRCTGSLSWCCRF